jgi:hypothetical protein
MGAIMAMIISVESTPTERIQSGVNSRAQLEPHMMAAGSADQKGAATIKAHAAQLPATIQAQILADSFLL